MASAALTLDSLPRNPRESVKKVLNAAHKQLTWAAALHENVENHVTHADQRTALAPAIRQQLVDFYWEDYRLFLTNNVLGLPASKPSI